MPIYEFNCKDCGKDYEELVPVNSEKFPPCPSCSSERIEKKMSVFGGLTSSSGSCGTSGFS